MPNIRLNGLWPTGDIEPHYGDHTSGYAKYANQFSLILLEGLKDLRYDKLMIKQRLKRWLDESSGYGASIWRLSMDLDMVRIEIIVSFFFGNWG